MARISNVSAPAVGTEGSFIDIVVTRNDPGNGDRTFTYRITSNTATATDFADPTQFDRDIAVNWEPGATTATVRIALASDSVADLGEMFDFTARSNQFPNEPTTRSVTIENNTAPTLSGFAPAGAFVAGRTQLIDDDVVFSDTEGNFLGGRLTLSGISAGDVLTVRNQGTGAGQIGVNGTTVSYEGTAIGTLVGGNGQALTISFVTSGTSPSAAAVDALIQNLQLTASRTAGDRTLSLNVFDSGGLSLQPPAAFVELTGTANPFNGIDTGRIASPRFIDLDGDGDSDAIVGDETGRFLVFRNNGSGQAFTPLFGAANPLDGVDIGYYSRPGVVDLDGDGDLDLVATDSSYGTLRAFRNNGVGQQFTELTGTANPFTGIDYVGFSAPGFVDIDGDGDLDTVVVNSEDGSVRSFRNNGVGVSVSELTGAANPFSGFYIGTFAATDFIDLDGDGDSDALIADRDGNVRTFRNNGTNQPFTELTDTANPFNSVDVGQFAGIGVVDIDNDGDLDAVIGSDTRTNSLRTFRNTGDVPSQVASVVLAPTNTAPTLTGLTTGLTVAENAAPTLIDADVTLSDAEGNWDGGRVGVTGLLAEDVVAVRNQGSGVGEIGVAGTTVSYGGVVIGTIAGGTGTALTVTFNAAATNEAVDALVQNLTYASTSDNPTASRQLKVSVTDGADAAAIGAARYTYLGTNAGPFAGQDTGNYARAAFIDIDGDGRLDAVVGQDNGPLQYFRNVTAAGTPAQYVEQASNPFATFGTISRGFPAAVDLDGDGDLDLVFGGNSQVRAVLNTGTPGGPAAFTELTGGNNPFAGLGVFQAAPGFTDLNADGKLDLVLGQQNGIFRTFVNTAATGAIASYTELTGAQNPLNGVDLGFYSTPTFADLDGDGDLDLVTGENASRLFVFLNTAEAGQPVTYRQATDAENPFASLNSNNPIRQRSAASFFDFDGDGDLDVAIGDFGGPAIKTLRNDANGVTVNVTAANDVPAVGNLQGDAITFTENGTARIALDIGQDALVTDPDNQNFTGGSLTVRITTNVAAGEDELSFGARGGISNTDTQVTFDGVGFATFNSVGTERVFTFNANATPAAVQALIRSIEYFNANTGNPSTAQRTVEFVLNDGSGGISTTTTSVAITAVDDAPVITLSPGDATSSEQTPTVIDAGVTIVDPDSPITFVQIEIGGVQEGDRLGFVNTGAAQFGDIAISTNISDVLVLRSPSGTATNAQFQNALRAITFTNTLDTAISGSRTVFFLANGSNVDSNNPSKQLIFTATDDAPVAVADTGTVAENATTNIAVAFNDTDVDAGPKAVAMIEGQAATVGQAVTLASGALVTLDEDGTIRYDPNGRFNYLVSLETAQVTGAASSATDSFAYQLNGGSSATATVTIEGVDGPGDELRGTPNNDRITGTDRADQIYVFQGGDDTVSGGAGNDFIYYGQAFTNADSNDGGTGTDTVALGGTYNLTFAADDLVNVERLLVYGGQTIGSGPTSYTLTTDDANTGRIGRLVVDGSTLGAGETLVFNGSAETDGRFTVTGGAGTDTLVGGQQNDALIGGAGSDQLFGLAGDDYLVGGAGADTLRGGIGRDIFVYTSVEESGLIDDGAFVDQIVDFQRGADRIDLSRIDANTQVDADQTFQFIGAADFSGTAGELRIVNSEGVFYVEGDTNGDGQADLIIGVNSFNQELTAADFFL